MEALYARAKASVAIVGITGSPRLMRIKQKHPKNYLKKTREGTVRKKRKKLEKYVDTAYPDCNSMDGYTSCNGGARILDGSTGSHPS